MHDHRIDILQRPHTHVDEPEIGASGDRYPRGIGDADPTGRRYLLNALRDDQAMAIGSIAVPVHRSQVDPDPEGKGAAFSLPCCGIGQVPLDGECEVDGSPRIVKLGKDPVAGLVDDPSAVVPNQLAEQ
ncbi:MAG: hypothetical protein WAS21_32305 [Geminicoccaceae bacterium]